MPYPSSYYPQIAGWQPYQQTPQAFQQYPASQPQRPVRPVIGHYVNSEDEISAEDIPKDGSFGVFPSADGSCIYVRQVTNDFTLRKLKYVLATEEKPAQREDYGHEISALSARVEAIERALSGSSQAAHMRKGEQDA